MSPGMDQQDDYEQDDIDWFWHTIERSNRNAENLRQILAGITKEEIYKFQDIFIELATELQDEPYRHYVDPGESEDGLEDISRYVVSQGKSAYSGVRENPELMPPNVDVGDPADLSHVAYEVYYDRFGEPLEVM